MSGKQTYKELEERVNELEKQLAKLSKAEEALRESEERYRQLVNHAPAGIYEVDFKKQRFVSVNDVMCEYTDYQKEDFLSLNPLDILTEDSKKLFLERLSKIFVGEKVPETVEYKIRGKGGREIWVILNTRLDYENGVPKGATVVVHNITERKLAEEALRESEEKYRLLVNNANDGIFIGQDGTIKFPNPKTEEVLGYSAKELSKTLYLDLVHPEDRATIIERQERRRRGETLSSTYSIRIINRAGEEIWAQVGAVPITWEGRPATLNFVRDITPQKRLETQLHQAQKMEAIGTLAGGIAHDFNNLLMGIQGNASLMLLDIDSRDPHYGKLKNIEQYIQNGAELTKQLLGFARGGKYEVKPTDLNKLIEKSSEMFGRTKKEITIHKKYQEGIWPAEVDQGQIEQVLLNLFVNAWQAMPGGGTLYLQTKNVMFDADYVKPFNMEPGRYVKISVTDTGVGMDEATQQRIFDPFFTTKEMGRGTGLRLASTYGIIKNHGGIIDVYSEKGAGTTFNIYLPASEKEVAEGNKSNEDILKGKETILLVDDEDMVIDVGKQMLNKIGYDVIIAKTGKEAIEIYKENKDKIDMIILDMIMPDIGGGEVYDMFKEINPKVRVLLSSGYSLEGEGTKILERGCDGFIQKPFTMKQMSQKMREILEKK